ncbi:MAG: hypothetical protein H7X94_11230, partial [Vallitaleaceae bacterium]|nr:hypothetical protein [Vallitaleaceae bacterium]
IGVSNYYNIVAAQKTIELIKKKSHNELKIYVGGHAFENNFNAVTQIGADDLVQSFEDIKKTVEGGFVHETCV